MKYILYICVCLISCSSFSQDIIIDKDTSFVSWTVAPTKIIHFTSRGKISAGTLTGGVIDASIHQKIFDTAVNLVNIKTYMNFFSVKWYGAGTYADNSVAIQKSIDITKNVVPLYFPLGTYTYSTPLVIAFVYKGSYAGVMFSMFGDNNVWNAQTVLNYTGTAGSALSVQIGKGVSIKGISITGRFKAPNVPDFDYYQLTYGQYLDTTCDQGLTGLSIDPIGVSVSGTTGLEVKNVKISGFYTCIGITQNGVSKNADNLLFENIEVAEARDGFVGTQAQEKGNVIRNIFSWGKIHTLFSIGNKYAGQAGFYNIDGANIAGACIRLFNITTAGWYPTSISHVFAESIGTIGVITGFIPMSISNSTFHFKLPMYTPRRVLLISDNPQLRFDNCLFRYYGTGDSLSLANAPVYSNCKFSGITQGVTVTNAAQYNDIIVPPQVKIRIKVE